MSSRPILIQREATAACGVSRTTIRHRREAGDLPNSIQEAEWGWLIPVDDLLAAGLRFHQRSPADVEASPGPEGRPVAEEPSTAALRAELEHLRHTHALAIGEVQHLREQLAARGRAHRGLRGTLAALLPSPAGGPVVSRS